MDRKRLAIHEAGHAIVARCKGMKVTAIIIDDLDIGAATWTHFRTAGSWENKLALSLAGMLAEECLLGDHDPQLCITHEQDAAVAAIQVGVAKGSLEGAAILGMDADAVLKSGLPGAENAKALIERTKLSTKAILMLNKDKLGRLSELLLERGRCWFDDPDVVDILG